ncbi:MAG: hypothetical protein VXY42_03025 [Candidatus Thermoplasmatota archaeon]|nr:hypothetical protein [Candidatus Thermoplasmatota archaeon]MEC8609459.1 hypothetical protein [Candidatus Thermoplasmatota archaeon]
MRERALALVCLMLLSLLSTSAAIPDEDQNFQPSHNGTDFPVGFVDFAQQGGAFESEHRLVYPAMDSGEGEEMAGNGPFPWVLLLIDENESPDNYMLISTEIAQRGTIVYIHTEITAQTNPTIQSVMVSILDVQSWMNQANQTNNVVLGMYGSVDEQHWGLIGHGYGATLASNVYVLWEDLIVDESLQPPRALVGLAMQVDSVQDPIVISGAMPNIALYITGSADEVAPATENVIPVLENVDGLAWQILHSLGANHYQYQDTSSFIEDFNDGDASLTQEEQIDHAMDHILPYFDLTLRGDHSKFREAFNRENNLYSSSDSNGYVDELLDDAKLIRISNVTSLNGTVFGPQEDANFSALWSMRNGDVYSDLPQSWTIEGHCLLDNQTTYQATISNENVSCMVPMQGIAPGPHELRLVVSVEGGTGYASFDFYRTNAPIEFVEPLPELLVPQRGSFVLNASDIATDPDGQSVRILNATLLENESHFVVAISPDASSLTVFHSVDEEWEGSTKIRLDLEAEGEILDQANVILNGSVIPVDDQIIQLTTINQQTLIEDGESLYFNYSNYFIDPEQQPLTVLINGESQGEGNIVSWNVSNDMQLIAFTPLRNANGAEVLQLSISDGFNPPLFADVPLRIEAVDDDFVVDESAWTIAMDEEGTVLLSLTTFASDIDGDALTWTIESNGDSKVVAALSGQELLITARLDEWGTDTGWWLNVSDGSTTFSKELNVSIAPQPDRPTLSNASVERTGSTNLKISWMWSDSDGDTMDVIIQIDGDEKLGERTCDAQDVCSERIEMDLQPGSAVNIDIIARDSSFSDVSTRLQYIVPDEESTSTTGDNSESESGGTLVAAIIIVPLLAVIGWLLFQFKKPPQEPQKASSSGGLLARAEATINQS